MKKYRILVIGGTRFIGRALVRDLLEKNHLVTITSRKRLADHPNLTQITCLRETLSGFLDRFDEFDYVIDFNAYEFADIKNLPIGTPKFNYYLISSQWVSTYLNNHKAERFTDVERNYILSKRRIEIATLERFGSKARIIRFPVVVGTGDHHRRIDYLVNRIFSKKSILVPNASQLLDIAWLDDIVQTIHLSLFSAKQIPQITRIRMRPCTTYAQFVIDIADEIGSKVEIVDLNTNKPTANLVNFLKADPFWREEYFDSEIDILGDVVNHLDLPLKAKIFSGFSKIASSDSSYLHQVKNLGF